MELPHAGFSPNVTLPPLPPIRTAANVGAMFCNDNGYFGGVRIACNGSNINPVALNILNLKLPNGSYYIPGSGNGGYQTVPYSIPAKFQEDQFLINIDYKITGKNTIAERFFYAHDPQLSNFTGVLSSGAFVALNNLPGAPSNIVTGNVNGVVKLTSTLTANLSNEMRISGQHYLLTDTPLLRPRSPTATLKSPRWFPRWTRSTSSTSQVCSFWVGTASWTTTPPTSTNGPTRFLGRMASTRFARALRWSADSGT